MENNETSNKPAVQYAYSQWFMSTSGILINEIKEIEESYQNEGWDGLQSKDHLKHRGYFISSIINTMSFFEALINELYSYSVQGRITPRMKDSDKLDDSFYDRLRWIHDLQSTQLKFSRIGTLQKYQMILIAAECDPFVEGESPFQEANMVRRIRNYFVHYEPEWLPLGEQKHIEHQIGSSLQGKFNLNPLALDGRPFFPNHCISHGCANWALISIQEFVSEFHRKLEVEEYFQGSGKMLRGFE